MAVYTCSSIARGLYSGEVDLQRCKNIIKFAKDVAEYADCGKATKMYVYIHPMMTPVTKTRYKFTATIVLHVKGDIHASSEKEASQIFLEQNATRDFGLLKNVEFEPERVWEWGTQEADTFGSDGYRGKFDEENFHILD